MSLNIRHLLLLVGTLVLGATLVAAAAPGGDAGHGASAFRQCAACHSLLPGEHLTGPSLAGLWGRKAGTVEGFTRYSEALKNSKVVWNEQTLDTWLKDPQGLVADNLMTFPGIPDARQRADLIAYLRAVVADQGPPGGMPSPRRAGLKEVGSDRRVKGIRYCGDTYYVTTAAGRTLPFWEFNLRFKTDSSPDGPSRGEPVLLPAGMMGDRAFVVFASPEEMSAMIERKC